MTVTPAAPPTYPPNQETAVADWDGRHPDYPLIIDILLDIDGRLRDHQPNDN